MYDFSLDKKTLIFITVCCLTVGGLLFFAGIVVGLDRGSHETQARMEKEFSARLAAAKAAVLPEAAQSQPGGPVVAAATPESSEPAPAESRQASDASYQPQLLTVAATNRSSVSQKPESTTAIAEESAATDAQEAGTEEEADADSEPANDYSLQIGAFRSQDNAARLRDDLKAKGYGVFLLRMVDERGNEWHTVRLGHYHDRAEASNEAASFSEIGRASCRERV